MKIVKKTRNTRKQPYIFRTFAPGIYGFYDNLGELRQKRCR